MVFRHESVVEIKLKSNPMLLGLLRVAVGEIASKMGFSSGEINDLKLAVNEACANVIKHAYNKDTNQDIVVNFLIRLDALEIIIKDFGEKVAPSEFKSRSLDEMEEGGLGVYLIKKLVDKVKYDIMEPKVGTELHLVKFLKKEA